MVHFKNRYMVMEVFIDAGRGESDPVILTQFNVTKVIRDSIQLNFGECDLAASLGSLQVKYVNPVTKLCIIRVSREDHQKVWTAITMVRSIGKIPVSFNLLDVSASGHAGELHWSATKQSLSNTSWLLLTVSRRRSSCPYRANELVYSVSCFSLAISCLWVKEKERNIQCIV
ncbi:hypothetical protein PVAP13_7KG059700 [Panicum virgatum]|uniref:Uncharacterized protein n=1 Tax=Panicum virgatum TaxID=38727 RepID=A0A8T0QL16_PANVG|nr:hypothetical protein PVAP13_7KG059700 [Panicum virgatum]